MNVTTVGIDLAKSVIRCAPGTAKRWRVERGRRVAAGEAVAYPRRKATVGERVRRRSAPRSTAGWPRPGERSETRKH